MKIGLFSDLHLEFHNDTASAMKVIRKLQNAAVDVDLMINAGDTHPSANARKQVAKLFEKGKYIEVLGNHDHYGSNWPTDDYKVYDQGGVKVLAATLWTNFASNPLVEMDSQRQIYDFRVIKGVTPAKMVDTFNRTCDYVNLIRPDVVVTHFAPHPGSTHPKYAGQSLNPYFVNNLDDLIHHTCPALWLHGHVHDAFDYKVHATRVICNPLGYPGETYHSINDYEVKIIEL